MEFIKNDVKIYILSGKSGCGKTQAANCIIDYYGKYNKKGVDLAYAYYLKDYAKRILGWDGKEETKPRDFLQQIGSELIKKHVNKDLVVNRLLDDIEVFSYFYDVIVISDARFIDEINLVKDRYKDSISINIVRNQENKLTTEERKHDTETSLDNYSGYDYVLKNNGTLIELEVQVIDIIKEVDNNE